MKGTDHFKRTIQMYLEQRAAEDALFAKNYRNPAKNIDDCVTYILNYVQKSGCNGFTDGEIGVDDPVLLPSLRAVPKDGRVGRAERDAFARVMCVGFRRQ